MFEFFKKIHIFILGVVSIASFVWAILNYTTWTLLFSLLLLSSVGSQVLSVFLLGAVPIAASVSTAFYLATVILFGLEAGLIVSIISETVLSVNTILRSNRLGWRGGLERLMANTGMAAVAMLLAGLTFVNLESLFSNSILAVGIAWLVSATVYSQVNFWLLTIVIYFTYGIEPLDTFQDHKANMPIDILVTGIGGGLLALSIDTFGTIGLLALLLPILASTYSYSYIVRKSQEQMENLEELVDLRTAALQKAIDDLEALQREKDHFVAVLTHDMRTPLTSIQGYANLLIMKELERDRQVHMANVILRNSNTLLDIVNNLLDVERLKAGKEIELEYSSFDFSLVVSQVLEEVASRADDKQIAVHYQPPSSPIMLWADKRQIKRVLQNLVSNGVKYTPEKGEVTVTTQSMTGQVLIRVEDNGYGIPDDELPTIFDSYSRVKDHQHVAVGTGLGLAIVKNLVEAHKGLITVDSELDEGTTFTVIVPNEPIV